MDFVSMGSSNPILQISLYRQRPEVGYRVFVSLAECEFSIHPPKTVTRTTSVQMLFSHTITTFIRIQTFSFLRNWRSITQRGDLSKKGYIVLKFILLCVINIPEMVKYNNITCRYKHFKLNLLSKSIPRSASCPEEECVNWQFLGASYKN